MEMAGATAVVEFFLKLKKEGVATNPVESKARSLWKERSSKEGGKNNPSKSKDQIKDRGKNESRDIEVVRALLEVKVKASYEYQMELEKKYKEE